MPADAIEVGRIADAWGIKGWFKVLPHSASPEALFSSKRWYLLPSDRNVGANKSPSQKLAAALSVSAAKPVLLKISEAKNHADTVVASSLDVADRNQAEALNLSKQVIETIHDEVPDWTNQEVRTILGRFLFTGETVFKPVGALSGGEKARLALAKMLLSPCNLLILDEPTNHLDIPAKEMLEEAIQDYDGTAILVSHDRYFISKVANKIVEIRNGELVVYAGDYHYYLDKLEEEKEKEKLRQEEAKKAAKKAQKKASSKK
jgi:ATPase subunit of ABC transporter with duplicated ATPase domains